mmetsp:Transcript_107422/g.331881  ORF Transcript_107422/g.331881 Transcript_107422/m.331881 type:complete len:84 (+) Transcript_107422:134-385(+)
MEEVAVVPRQLGEPRGSAAALGRAPHGPDCAAGVVEPAVFLLAVGAELREGDFVPPCQAASAEARAGGRRCGWAGPGHACSVR